MRFVRYRDTLFTSYIILIHTLFILFKYALPFWQFSSILTKTLISITTLNYLTKNVNTLRKYKIGLVLDMGCLTSSLNRTLVVETRI